MYFSIDGLGLFLVKLEHLLSLSDPLLGIDHLLYLDFLLKVVAALDFVLDYLILLHETLVLLTHGLILLSLGCLLSMGATKPNADCPSLDAVDLPLILLVFYLLLLLCGDLLVE